jgi:peroxiredoxin
MPALERLHNALGAEGLTVVAVSVDAPALGLDDPNESVRAFAEQLGLTFPILVDASGGVENTFRVSGLPSTFVIDRQGKLRQRILGPRPWDQPETISEIRALLEE